MMEITKATVHDEGKETWLTLRCEKEFLVIHVISNEPLEWSKSEDNLNIKPKRIDE